MSRKPLVSILASFCLLLGNAARGDHAPQGFGSATTGALTTLSAATLPAGALTFGLRLQTIGFQRFPDAELDRYADAGEHVHGLDRLFNGSLSLAYGAAEDFTLVASLPYVSRQGQREAMHAHPDEHAHGDDAPLPLPEVLPLFGLGAARANHEHADPAHAEAAAVRDLNDASGLGDLIVLGQYRWLHDAAAGRQGAWLFGLKTPTGRTDLRNADGERLEVHHQPGSGSWDILLGAAFTRRWAVGACDANLLYTHTGHGSQDTRLGRGFAYNLGFSRRLASPAAPQEPHTHHHHEHPHAQPETGSVNNTLNWDLMLELNGEWRDRERQTGVSVENTGGHLLYLAPGLRASQGRWSAGLSLGVPVVQDLNGIQSAADYRLLVSLGASLQ